MKIAALTRGLVVVAAMALVAGCTTSGFSDGGKDTLTILTHYGNDPLKSGLQKLVDEWNGTHPDIQVETQAVAFDDLLNTITVRQTGGQAPDMVHAYGLWGGQLQAADVLAPPPQDVVADVEANFSKAAVGSVTVDGQVLGYPTELQTYALYYNKKLLADAGIGEPPSTWDELEEVAAKTTVYDSSGNIDVAGFGMPSGQDSAVVHPFASLLQAAGGRYMAEDGQTSAFDSPEGAQALALQKRLIDNRLADPAINVFKGFPSQKVAMTINAGWWTGSLKAVMGDDYADVGVTAIPGPDEGDRGSLAFGYFAGVNARSQKQEESWKFLRWLNAEQTSNGATRMGTFQASLGTVPSRTSDAEALTGTGGDPNVAAFIEAMDYALPEPNPRGGQQVKSALQASIESVWTDERTIAEALADAAAEADATLARNK